jgi:riboflavin kinase/FMN adenylyltransferase
VNSIRPTVEGKRERGFSGFAIFDFDEEIYGQDIEVAFLDYLRPEQKFSGIEELQSQIERDAARLARSTRLDSREQ